MKKENQKLLQFRPVGQRGFSLVELMVASTIGLILLGGIGYVLLGSRQTFRTQDDFSRIQENVRYALDQVGVDVRMAGYAGCLNLASIDPANPGAAPAIGVIASNPPTVGLGDAMRGYVGTNWVTMGAPGTAPANWVSGTGVFSISRASAVAVNLTGNTTPTNANIQIAGNPDNFIAGEALLVSNCVTADLFRATTVSGGGTVTIAHSSSSNTANFTIYSYGDEAEIFRMISNTYFIGTNPAGVPALYRQPMTGNAEEMVDNVENIVMRFGLDDGSNGGTANDFIVDSYVDSAGVGTNWRQVMTVRLSMVFRGNTNNIATQVQPCVVENIACTAAFTNTADRRLRQVATATFGLRNRLP
ncbi:MAG: PilW family protein [Thiobacillus sp.]|nr:PilW family protein [Thiobacillus sp.]